MAGCDPEQAGIPSRASPLTALAHVGEPGEVEGWEEVCVSWVPAVPAGMPATPGWGRQGGGGCVVGWPPYCRSRRGEPHPTKVSSKLTRVSSELTRVSSKLTGVSSKLARVYSELARVSSELSRVSSELTRVSSELTRVSSKLTRINSKLTRVSSELFKLLDIIGKSANI